MQNLPEEIHKLIAKIRDGYDYVGSIRRVRQDSGWRIILFGIDLAGEYVGRILQQVRARPFYVVQTILQPQGGKEMRLHTDVAEKR